MTGGWRRILRVALVLGFLGVGVSVLFGLRDRVKLEQPEELERGDPDAVIQTRGSRIVQADPLGDSFEIASGGQSTYEDGRMRWFDDVVVTIEDREDRTGFVLSGETATINPGQTDIQFVGGVTMVSSDGLSASTEEAFYDDQRGLVEMPGAAAFVLPRDGMEASGERAEYDRNSAVLRLFGSSQVDLVKGDALTRIRSRKATLAETGGLMRFDDDVTIDTDSQQMTAGEAQVFMRGETNDLESLELGRGVRISGKDSTPGALQDMSADDIRLVYRLDGAGLERATLSGETVLEMFGPGGATGTVIGSDAMDVMFGADQEELAELIARGDVSLVLPQSSGDPAQRVTSEVLTISSSDGAGLDFAEFENSVVFREVDGTGEDDTVRITRAQKLEATLSDGLASLDQARFLGEVVLENGEVVAYADEALYTLTTSEVELMRGETDGQTPRLLDSRRGSIQALGMTLGLDSGRITARGEVESVLSTQAEASDSLNRPGILEASEPVYVTAAELDYDDEAEATTYSGGARLWQSQTVFDAADIALDDVNGSLKAIGGVRTEFLVNQINDETGSPEESLTRGRAQEFDYDNDKHLATYHTDARLTGPRADMKGDVIRVFLQPDGRTLDRIEADGNVELIMPTRLVSGDTLVYYDADGRYETYGAPVRITEEQDEGCRETTGRSLIFFLTEDAISVDGQSEVRTEAATVTCPPFAR
jgi:lipopolysaccharide export system protein LptA